MKIVQFLVFQLRVYFCTPQAFFVRFDGNSFHPKWPKLISPGAKLISPKAKLISPTAKLIFWNQKKTTFLLSLAPFFSKGDTERTKSHSKHPRLGNFLKFANKYWEKAQISLKIDQISFQKGKNSFQKCWNSFHKMPKLIFSAFGVSGGDWISHKKKPGMAENRFEFSRS